jgi:hypothetical protein
MSAKAKFNGAFGKYYLRAGAWFRIAESAEITVPVTGGHQHDLLSRGLLSHVQRVMDQFGH